jgi:hypothetical protein
MSEYRTPAQIASKIPSFRENKSTHPHTVIRWMTTGVKRSDGSRLKLKAVRFPGGFRTTDAWVDEFIDALTKDRTGSTVRPVDDARARRANAVLAASGW